jgi:GntR family transcriptional regulator, N-acetylglucosamine utilization regulator
MTSTRGTDEVGGGGVEVDGTDESMLLNWRPDRRRPEPLWHQVEEAIRAGIHQGLFKVDERLPREERLAALLGVSRITIRHALSNLENESLVRREHGRGTFVRSPRLVAGARRLTSLSQELAALGLEARSELLDLRLVGADGEVARGLEVEAGEPVWRVHRLRLVGDEEIGVQKAHLRVDRVGELDPGSLEGRSLYQVLHQRAGIEPLEAVETYRVGGASPNDAALLGIPPGDPVFTILRITSDRIGPFEVTHSTMRGDRYEIRSALRRP